MSRTTIQPTASQFQLIGGQRHEPADCCVRIEPGGQAQARKGALYLVTEPAGDPALGSDACRLVQATIAREYYADPSPSLTSSLTTALNKANQALIQYNRQVLAAGDPPPGLPRKIRVGLTAAVLRSGALYLCQLAPSLTLWVHQGQLVAFPRPRQWPPLPPQVNGDGEVVPTLYPAPALGTYPVVEADYAYRRADPGDLLILASSNLSPLLEEDAVEAVLLQDSTVDVATNFLHRLATMQGLPEAHALAVVVSTRPGQSGGSWPIPTVDPLPHGPAARPDEGDLVDLIAGIDDTRPDPADAPTAPVPVTGGLGSRLSTITGQLRERWGRPRPPEAPTADQDSTNGATPPPAPWANDPRAGTEYLPTPWEMDSQRLNVAPPAPADYPEPNGKVIPLRRNQPNSPPLAPASPLSAEPPHSALRPPQSGGLPPITPEEYDQRDLPEHLRWRPRERRQSLADFMDVVKSDEGEDRQPEGGSATRAVPLPDEASPPPRPNPLLTVLGQVGSRLGRAGRIAAPVVGRMGKATLSGVGGVLQETLPESVRQRGADGMLHPDGSLRVEEEPETDEIFPEDDGRAGPQYDGEAAHLQGPSTIYDASAEPATAPAAAPGVLKVLVPVAIVILLVVLGFSVQGVLSGQQATKVQSYLTQAQQEELQARQTDDVGAKRSFLLQALEHAAAALDVDPKSSEAATMNARVQSELDTLSGVQRLAGLTLLLDFADTNDGSSPTPVAQTAITPALGVLTTTTAPADTTTADRSDYLSQVVVHGDDIYLLDRGAGRLYHYSLSTHERTTILSPGDTVGSNGGGNATVKPLLYVAWRPTSEGGDLAALDEGQVAYLRQPDTGEWTAFPLGGADKLDKPRDLGAFDGNLYLLWAKPGQISKWIAGQYDQPSTDWLGDPAVTELRSRNPVSLAVDGDVYLLLGNGQIVLITAGQIKNTIALPVWPSIASPLALFTTADSQSLYLVEAGDKRIIRVNKADGTVQMQMKAPADSTAFDNLRNVYVDEAAGKLYILSGKRLYTATLPSLPGGSAATPTATQVP